MTRLEKIRSMSAEEWAEVIMKKTDFDKFCAPGACTHYKNGHCEFFSGDLEIGVSDETLDTACREACVNYLNEEIADK